MPAATPRNACSTRRQGAKSPRLNIGRSSSFSSGKAFTTVAFTARYSSGIRSSSGKVRHFFSFSICLTVYLTVCLTAFLCLTTSLSLSLTVSIFDHLSGKDATNTGLATLVRNGYCDSMEEFTPVQYSIDQIQRMGTEVSDLRWNVPQAPITLDADLDDW